MELTASGGVLLLVSCMCDWGGGVVVCNVRYTRTHHTARCLTRNSGNTKRRFFFLGFSRSNFSEKGSRGCSEAWHPTGIVQLVLALCRRVKAGDAVRHAPTYPVWT